MAEELRIEERRGEGGSIHGDEGLVGPAADPVDGPGHQLLAGAALAADEDAVVAQGDAFHLGQRLHEPPVLGDEVLEGLPEARPVPASALANPAKLLAHARKLSSARSRQAIEPPGLHRLAQVVMGAELHGLDGELHVAHAGDDHHLEGRVVLADPAEHVHAAHHRHVHVEQEQVEVAPRDGLERPGAVAQHLHLVPPGLGEQHLEAVQHRQVVVEDQDPAHAVAPPRPAAGCGRSSPFPPGSRRRCARRAAG